MLKKFLLVLISAFIFIHCINIKVFAETDDSYKSVFQKDKIIDINIDIDDKDLKDMNDYGENEEYHSADVTINGTKINNVGIRAKGNMTLNSVSRSDSDRYSYRIKFDKYVKGQTYMGLDDLCLNNGYSDASYMREYLHYEILRELGMNVAETSFCNLYINGELFGFYLAVEALDDTFLEENFGSDYLKGNFYKMNEGSTLSYKENEDYNYVDLKSGDDKNLDDFKDFVKKLNAITTGDKGNIESFLDVDSALKYIASNTVLSNYDSYNGNLHHNFYLYENSNGVFTVVPWDFNMSFGGLGGENSDVGIDTPFVSGSLEELPLINKLLSVDEYKEKYYGYINQLIDILDNFQSRVSELKTLISPYVQSDPTKFVTYEEFDNATKLSESSEIVKNEEKNHNRAFGNDNSIINCVINRVDNIKKQLNGEAEKTSSVQEDNHKRDNMQKPPKDFNGENFNPERKGEMQPPPFNNNNKTKNSKIRVHLNGHIIEFDESPVIESSITLVDFKSIVEELTDVTWDFNNNEITISKDDKNIKMTIGSAVAYVNNEKVELDVAPKKINDTVMVPLRFVSEQLDLKVSWDESTRLITLTSK